MRLRLIRNATLSIRVADRRVLVDPMLDPPGARPPVEDTPNDRRNPLVPLPEPAAVVVEGLAGVLVTHLHQDHLDATAVGLLGGDLPVLCQPEDEAALRERGFRDVRPVAGVLDWDGVTVTRTYAQHGTGEVAEALAPVCGYVLAAPGEPTLYIAGDTIWCDEVRETIDTHRPDVIVVNAGGARFVYGDPIVMTADHVVAVARHAPHARVVAVHLEAINHCVETRADLRQRLHDENLTAQVTVPEDGAEVPL